MLLPVSRHYSQVIVETPGPGDPPIVRLHFECDQCPPAVWELHRAHLGTLVRVLVDVYATLGGDDGTTERLPVPQPEAEAALTESLNARVRSAMQAFKARRQGSR